MSELRSWSRYLGLVVAIALAVCLWGTYQAFRQTEIIANRHNLVLAINQVLSVGHDGEHLASARARLPEAFEAAVQAATPGSSSRVVLQQAERLSGNDGSKFEAALRGLREVRERALQETEEAIRGSQTFELSTLVGTVSIVGGLIALFSMIRHWRRIAERQEASAAAVREAERRETERTLSSISDCFFSLDRHGRFTYVNGEAERVTQRSREELLGKTIWEEFPHLEGTLILNEYRRVLATGENSKFETYFEPHQRWYSVQAYAAEGGGLSAFFRDATDRIEHGKQIESAKRQMDIAQHLAHVGSFEIDLASRTLHASDELIDLFGDDLDVVSPLDMVLEHVCGEEQTAVKLHFERLMNGVAPESLGFQIARSDGTFRKVICHAERVTEDQKVFGAMVDVTQRVALEAEIEETTEIMKEYTTLLMAQTQELSEVNAYLEQLAVVDGLTGAYNHRSFQDQLRQRLADASGSNASVAVLLMDVDHFKKYNDLFGHPAGDTVLRGVVEAIRSVTEGDEWVARYGGEEFAIITSRGGLYATELAERVRSAIERAEFENRSVTVSIGVAVAETTSSSTLIKQADEALYASKHGGRNRVTVYDPSINAVKKAS